MDYQGEDRVRGGPRQTYDARAGVGMLRAGPVVVLGVRLRVDIRIGPSGKRLSEKDHAPLLMPPSDISQSRCDLEILDCRFRGTCLTGMRISDLDVNTSTSSERATTVDSGDAALCCHAGTRHLCEFLRDEGT